MPLPNTSKGDQNSTPSLENYRKLSIYFFFTHIDWLLADVQKNFAVSFLLFVRLIIKDCPYYKITFYSDFSCLSLCKWISCFSQVIKIFPHLLITSDVLSLGYIYFCPRSLVCKFTSAWFHRIRYYLFIEGNRILKQLQFSCDIICTSLNYLHFEYSGSMKIIQHITTRTYGSSSQIITAYLEYAWLAEIIPSLVHLSATSSSFIRSSTKDHIRAT